MLYDVVSSAFIYVHTYIPVRGGSQSVFGHFYKVVYLLVNILFVCM